MNGFGKFLVCILVVIAMVAPAARPSAAAGAHGPEVAASSYVGASNEVTVSMPAGASGGWWSAAQEQIRQSEYDVTWQESTVVLDLPAAYQAPNRAQGLRTYFASDGAVVVPRLALGDWRWDVQLSTWGRAAAQQGPGTGNLTVQDNRADYRYTSGLAQWFVNTEQGLEQHFTLLAPADAGDDIVLNLAVSTGLEAHPSTDGTAVEFYDASGAAVLRYGDLHATDAAGHPLSSSFSLRGEGTAVILSIDTADAVFPITLDLGILGLSETLNWTSESDQNGANFGYSVATAGDVNADGFDDVIVGAPSYDGGLVDEGRAQVYHGSASGLSATANWTAEGDQAGASFGSSVGTAGDVNGDGYADIIVGAQQYDNGQADEGRAYVYYGSASGLITTSVWTAESNQAGAGFGRSVGTAGDVNGDGYADVIVGAYLYDTGQNDVGRAYIYQGGVAGLDTSPAWATEGDRAGANFGNSVGAAGDVNGDGYADVIIGAYLDDNNETDEGQAYVYHGTALGLSEVASWVTGSDQAGAHYGSSVGTAGDVNGDGYADVVVGAPLFDNGQTDEGRAFVYHGSATGLNVAASWTTESDQDGAGLGNAVGTAGDANGDGFADVIIGASTYSNGQTDEGQALVYNGSAEGLSAAPDWTAESDQGSAGFGCAVGMAGDVNGDGYADVIVGAYLYDSDEANEGRAYVYHGAASSLSAVAGWTGESNHLGAYFGFSVGTAGDVNGDGYADVVVGAYLFDNGQTDEGAAYVYYGSASGLGATADWTVEGNRPNVHFGNAVGTAGDVNGDGYADIIIGAHQYDNGQSNEGRAFVYHGSASGLSTTAGWIAESNQASAQFGWSVGTAGDVNGDGYADVIIGAIAYNGGQSLEGRAYVYHGGATGLGANPAWTAESNQADARFGRSVGTVGDVNGDGYSDIIVGSAGYDNPDQSEGGVWVYHGSALGVSSIANWTAEGNVGTAHFGFSVGTAGDVNGDGYSDIIVGAERISNGASEEGAAFAFYGSASGLSTTANWRAEGNQAGAYFGTSVGTAGDMNGDGYTDVIIGAPGYDNGQTNEGRTFVYHGSPTGLSALEAWTAESDQAGAAFGTSVGTAGDVNGDGYSDAIVGAHLYDDGGTDEGRAFLYYGNASEGLGILRRQRRADDSAPVAPGGQSISPTEARLAALARTPFGRSQVRLEWEVKPEGTAFTGTGLGQSTWQDSGTAGYAFDELVSSLSFETRYHWRVRIVGRPSNAAASSAATYRSRWLSGNTFFTALSGQQAVAATGPTSLLGQAAYVDVNAPGTLTSLILRGYPQTAHPHENDDGLGWLALDRYFTVTPNGGASGYDLDLCLNYDDSELGPVAETDLQLCRWETSAWACLPRSTASNVTLNLACADNVTLLSDWIIAGGDPTSVSFLRFDASPGSLLRAIGDWIARFGLLLP